MINVTVPYNEEKVKDIIAVLLHKKEDTTITIIRNGDGIKVIEGGSVQPQESLGEQVVCLEEALYNSRKGVLYKSILAAVEKPLIEHILKRTQGNQLKAARILGVNRNTMRAKIRKLGIDSRYFKQA